MKKKLIILGSIILVAIIALVFYQKSVQEGREQVLREMQTEQLRQQAEIEKKQRIEQLKNQLGDAKAALTMANNELQQINNFQLLRSASEKESQLSERYKKIERIKENTAKIEQALNDLQRIN